MIILMIVGMGLVTMIPRIIPVFVVEKLQFRPWVNRWLSAVPYAALGALIFPGVMTVIPDRPYIGLVGGLVAVVLALCRLNVVLVVIGAVVSVFVMTSF